MNWLRELFGDSTDSSSTEAVERSTASLYECPSCETVYISEGMQSCPECEARVDTVPDERELGLDG